MIFICSTTSNIPYTPEEPYHIILPINYSARPNIANKVALRHLRGMYFIWKNLDLFGYPDEITICQERRHLKHLHIPEGYDTVLPARTHISNNTKLSVYEQWCLCSKAKTHKKEYFEVLFDILPGFEEYSKIKDNPYARYHNIGTYPIEMYRQLCFFLFGTIDKLEEQLKVDPEGDNHCYAFLAERIADYWMYGHQEYRVFESDIVQYRT